LFELLLIQMFYFFVLADSTNRFSLLCQITSNLPVGQGSPNS